ncbi:MAG: hypothetical protein LBH16_02140 [Treponema sp.]|nr:hypothetical protein [Treponema sp.]
MKRVKFVEKTNIIPERLIGTKWKSWSEFLGERMTVEFIDESNCVYISKPRKYPMTYTVTGGILNIMELSRSFELRGDVLFNNDIPAFERTA